MVVISFVMSWWLVHSVPCLLPAGSCDRLQPPPATPLRQKQNGLFMFLEYQRQDIYFQLLTSILNCLLLWCRVSATVHDGSHAEHSLLLLLSPCTHASQPASCFGHWPLCSRWPQIYLVSAKSSPDKQHPGPTYGSLSLPFVFTLAPQPNPVEYRGMRWH